MTRRSEVMRRTGSVPKFDCRSKMTSLRCWWKRGVFELFQLVFNRQKVRRNRLFFARVLSDTKSSDRLSNAIIDSDCMQFQLIFFLNIVPSERQKKPFLRQLQKVLLDD